MQDGETGRKTTLRRASGLFFSDNGKTGKKEKKEAIVQVNQKFAQGGEKGRKKKFFAEKVIHMWKTSKQRKSDLYTKLSTMSTDFFRVKWKKIVVGRNACFVKI